MKAVQIDANIVLRLLTGDPPEMAEAAATVFARAEAGELALHLSRFTVAEVVWTLERAYKIARQDIARELMEFFSSHVLAVDDRDIVLESLGWYGELNVSFGDAIVASEMRRAGRRAIYSFDPDFDRVPGIERIAPVV